MTEQLAETLQSDHTEVNLLGEGSPEIAAPDNENTPVAQEEPTLNPDFLNSIDEEYRSTATQKGFKSVDDIMKSYTNLESMVGKKFDDMTNEELKSIYTKLGAPESPEDYGFEKAELPEGLQDSVTDWFANKAHELGLSKEAAQQLRSGFIEQQTEQYNQMIQSQQVSDIDNVNQLKQEFGSAFDERVNLAKQGLNEIGGESVKQLLQQHGLMNNAALVKMFSEVGKIISEGNMVDIADKSGGRFGITPDEAASKIAEKFQDSEFMNRYYSTMHPGHDAAVKELEELYILKNSN